MEQKQVHCLTFKHDNEPKTICGLAAIKREYDLTTMRHYAYSHNDVASDATTSKYEITSIYDHITCKRCLEGFRDSH